MSLVHVFPSLPLSRYPNFVSCQTMAAAPANMVCVPCRDPGLYCHCAGASAGCGFCIAWAHEHPEPTADAPHGVWDRRTRCTNSRAKQDRGVALPVCAGCRPYALIKPELRVIRDCCPPRAGQNVPIGNSPYILPVTASAASTAASSAAESPGVGPAAPGLQMPPYMQLPPSLLHYTTMAVAMVTSRRWLIRSKCSLPSCCSCARL